MKYRGQAAIAAGIIGVLIFVVIFAAVIPTVATQVVISTNGSGVAGYTAQNVTGAANTMLALTTLVFVAIGIVGVVKYVS